MYTCFNYVTDYVLLHTDFYIQSQIKLWTLIYPTLHQTPMLYCLTIASFPKKRIIRLNSVCYGQEKYQ